MYTCFQIFASVLPPPSSRSGSAAGGGGKKAHDSALPSAAGAPLGTDVPPCVSAAGEGPSAQRGRCIPWPALTPFSASASSQRPMGQSDGAESDAISASASTYIEHCFRLACTWAVVRSKELRQPCGACVIALPLEPIVGTAPSEPSSSAATAHGVDTVDSVKKAVREDPSVSTGSLSPGPPASSSVGAEGGAPQSAAPSGAAMDCPAYCAPRPACVVRAVAAEPLANNAAPRVPSGKGVGVEGTDFDSNGGRCCICGVAPSLQRQPRALAGSLVYAAASLPSASEGADGIIAEDSLGDGVGREACCDVCSLLVGKAGLVAGTGAGPIPFLEHPGMLAAALPASEGSSASTAEAPTVLPRHPLSSAVLSALEQTARADRARDSSEEGGDSTGMCVASTSATAASCAGDSGESALPPSASSASLSECGGGLAHTAAAAAGSKRRATDRDEDGPRHFVSSAMVGSTQLRPSLATWAPPDSGPCVCLVCAENAAPPERAIGGGSGSGPAAVTGSAFLCAFSPGCAHPAVPRHSYICTGHDAFLTHEPDAMDAMALVHARVSRVFFGVEDAARGALSGNTSGSGIMLHAIRSLNHHYRVFRISRN